MQLQKISPQSSLTEGSKASSQSILILKKSFSQSKKDCIQFDFLDSCHKGGSQNWSVSQFLPVFNKDKKFYTPTFILKADEPKYQIRDHVYRSLHQDRIQSNLDQETSDLRLPKPFKFNSYCIVCRKQFQDYQKHIHSKSHTDKMLSSQFCKDIDRFCIQFGNQSKNQSDLVEKKIKTKNIRKIVKQAKISDKIETKSEIGSIY